MNNGEIQNVDWSDLDANTQAYITSRLTHKQLVAYRLHIAGYGQRRIANILGISRQSAKERIEGANLKLRKDYL